MKLFFFSRNITSRSSLHRWELLHKLCEGFSKIVVSLQYSGEVRFRFSLIWFLFFSLLWFGFSHSALFLLEFLLCFVHIYTTQGLRVTWRPRKISHSLLHPRLFHVLRPRTWKFLHVTGSCLHVYHLEVPSPLCLLVSVLHMAHLCEERLLWRSVCAWICSLHWIKM